MSIKLTEQEAQSYYDAADELYDMYIEAADYVIENDLFFELGIPFNVVDAIKKSWENDVHWHIYGAFTFGGGLDGKPLKLLGFEADTPTNLVETSQEQLDDTQFNEIYEKVSTNFKRLITLDDGLELFDERYDGWKILFSAPSDDESKIKTSQILQAMAEDAGFNTGFSYLHEVEFAEDGICDKDGEEYEYWFKNYSWLDMATDEGELATTVTSIIDKQQAIILNPAYTLLFESLGMLKILKNLYPDSSYLLDASFEKSDNLVERTVFGDGVEFDNFKKIYLQDETYQNNAKVFFAYEACGLSFMSETESFITHEII